MRPEKLYLNGMVHAADAIQRFVQGVEPAVVPCSRLGDKGEVFLEDELRQRAVRQKPAVTGGIQPTVCAPPDPVAVPSPLGVLSHPLGDIIT